MSKIIVYNTDARQKLADGVDKLSKAVVTTLGPFGRNVIIEKENEKGFYKTYTRVVDRVTEFVLGVNPNFKYPHMLISTIIEGAHHQRYFSKHLPALTDCEEGKNNIVEFYKKLVTDTLKR